VSNITHSDGSRMFETEALVGYGAQKCHCRVPVRSRIILHTFEQIFKAVVSLVGVCVDCT